MYKSARILGQDYGLTAQEMNYALAQEGFLEGEPGDYHVTGKGEPYAHEQDHSSGNEASLAYYRQWGTRSWSEDVTDELGLDDERISEIRQGTAEESRLRREARQAAAEAAANPWPTFESEEEEDVEVNPAVVAGLLLGGVALYGIWKAAPHVQAYWADKAAPGLRRLKDRVLAKRKEDTSLKAEPSVPNADHMADTADGSEEPEEGPREDQ